MKISYNLADIDLEYQVFHWYSFSSEQNQMFMVRFSVSAELIKSLGSQH